LYDLTKNKDEAERSYEIIDKLHLAEKIQPQLSEILNEYNLQLKRTKSEDDWIQISNKFSEIFKKQQLK
jgi:predicted MarR family transcription regulator